MIIKTKHFSRADLNEFRSKQRVSFEILEETAAELKPGDTEKEVANTLVKRYRKAGADSFFHLPVVLFGERTALPGEWSIRNFFPRKIPLQEGDSVILDASPVFSGYLVDTSYSFAFGENGEHREMMSHLAQYRDSVCSAVNHGETFSQIADTVQKAIQNAGYEPVHSKHPGNVLGHRAIKTPRLPFQPRIQGFDAVSISWFRTMDKLANYQIWRKSPLWNQSHTSDHKPHDGLWLVEPHAGCGSTGAKWEEILVIENGQAEWLDENPPHVAQWARIAKGQDYLPLAR